MSGSVVGSLPSSSSVRQRLRHFRALGRSNNAEVWGDATMAQKLFIGGISFNTTSEGLRDFFAQAGTVLSANVITDQFSGRSRGFGCVEMATSDEAKRAIAE